MDSDDFKANSVKRPSLFWLATEFGRAFSELSASVPYRTFYRNDYQGDGHPVLVLPGFMASDFSTIPLRNFVNKLGYESFKWELGRNKAEVENLDLLSMKVEDIYATYNRPVSIIGWSLGGVYARQLAKANPHMIRQVITLGSPFRGIGEPNNVAWVYNLISGGKRVRDVDPALLADLPLPAPVPTTAIYSKEDGVVPWQVCVEKQETRIHQNIQVRGSHLGLGVNPSVLNIIADRLLYKESNWAPFGTQKKRKNLILYPSL